MPIILALLFFALLLFLYMWFVEPRGLLVRNEKLPVNPNHLQKSLRILFISDTHFGRWNGKKQVQRKLAAIKQAHHRSPFDLILLGGDYIDRDIRYLPLLAEFLQELQSFSRPMYGVLGNHDHHYHSITHEKIIATLEEGGVTVLRNQAELVTVGKEKIALVGIDDLEFSKEYGHSRFIKPEERQRRANQLDWYYQFDSFHPHQLRIMLAHNPDAFYLPGTTRPDVLFAGHTHGGQLAFLAAVAKWVYPILPRTGFLAWSGYQIRRGVHLLVSRGFGGSFLPIRFLRRPEVIAATLTPANIPKHLVIGLSGKAKTGKDTAAHIIQDSIPGLKLVNFSDAIREEFDAEFGTVTRFYESEKEKHRAKMQEFGVRKRQEDPGHWIKAVLAHEPPMLIAGVRLKNEAKAIKDAGGILVRIHVDPEVLRERVGAEAFDAAYKHHNENDLDDYTDWDYLIENNGTEKEFRRKVRELCKKLRKR